jgi:REP element-mobilizing transposase RayT
MRIFLDDRDYARFVNLLSDAVEELDVRCLNYCVMPNHYHATLCPTRPNLSDAIKKLNGEYAQWWNARHDHVGHVFQGRFKAPIVQEEGYLVRLCRYVALNPVRAGLAQRPEDWKWSSYAATTGLHPCPPFVDASTVLRHFGEDEEGLLQARFAEYVMSREERECSDDRIRSHEPILGSLEFKLAVRAGTVPAAATDDAEFRVLDTAAEPRLPAKVGID